MLSERDLELMQGQQEQNFPDVVRVKRKMRLSDGFGGWTYTDPETVHPALHVRITPAQMEEAFGERGRPLDINRYTVRCPVGTDILDEDILVTEDERELQVERVHDPRSNATLLTLTAERIA